MSKRFIALLLVLILALSVLIAGCGTDGKEIGSEDTDGQKPSEEGTTPQPEEKKYTIKWVGTSADRSPVEKDTPTEKYLEEKFNVDIEAYSLTDFNNQLAAMIASGDIPDVMFSFEPQNWQPLVDQGALAEVSEDVIRKNAPNAAKLIDETDPRVWAIGKYKGKNWAVPKVVGTEFNTGAVWRKDWLDKLGITKVPETLDEYAQAFDKIVNGDPDGDGKKDTYGCTGQGGHPVRQFDAVFGAYGIMPGQWRVVNDKVIMSTIMPEALQALTLLHDWYQKGYIDPEFITDNPQTAGQKFDAERLGMGWTALDNFHPDAPSGRATLDAWSKRNPDAKFAFGPIPAGPNGDRGDWLWGPRGNFVVFGAPLAQEPDKMAKILQMMDTILSDEELAIRVYWGEKGRTYDFIDAAKGPSGGLKYLPPYDTDPNARAKEGIGYFFQNLYPVYDWALPSITAKYRSQDLYKLNMELANWQEGRDALMRPYLPSAAQYQGNLDKLKTTAYSEFITGQRSLSDWDKFVNEWLDQGGRKLTEEAQQFYEENMKK
ncbi:extracellular solute-binding protein [Mahella australiensis]|uniref:Extracellular solute-binding protein family 1 n=1 Tax=Mahella australiensis (strain DSM 15567 / CIP 107919 / 50-1 BON) TaxID=697281 RepID=F3ZWT4_MAHA5|nr:extracellular solute-binding protein [Mahella australiensis]AEE96527.1 extracellular solute-binding protein family 1 [Mahella australiensis 50-1 BON]